MPSINLLIMSLLAALLASLTLASPIEHTTPANVTTTFTPTIESRDGAINGWMNWYQTCRSCSLDPIRVVGWTYNVCRKFNQQSTSHASNILTQPSQSPCPSQTKTAPTTGRQTTLSGSKPRQATMRAAGCTRE
jgi:hypothetical protein